MALKQQAKSKTVQFNAIAAAIIPILTACGVDIPPEAVAGIMALANIIIRQFTKGAVGDK
jgi:hypothetical protein